MSRRFPVQHQPPIQLMARSTPSSHSWKFFRAGGLDQVALESAADLRALGQLDQKLWVALSCPVLGVEIDEATLKLIDQDGDGRIRVPELVAAIDWAAARLKDPADLLRGEDRLPIAAIDDSTDAGKALVASARQILIRLNRSEEAVAVTDAANTAGIFAANPLNGDGVIPPEASDDPAVQALIKDIMACCGSEPDRTGSAGVTAGQIETFFAEAAAYIAWVEQSATKEVAILGEATGQALAALQAVRAKIDDYFVRCSLAAFDTRATVALNRAETDYAVFAAKDLKPGADEIASFPLARIEAKRPLPLLEGVNPAWAGALAKFHADVVTPIFGAAKTSLTQAEWNDLTAGFTAYETWLGKKTGSTVEKLGVERLRTILQGTERAVLADLVARDRALEPEFKGISDVERLARYYRDLAKLLKNFVNFADFYSLDRMAVFQAGTLYLDSRSTELCIRVDGPSPLAAMSKICIAYCTCTRPGGATMNIAAGFTQGDSDYLFVGRRGVFYDRQGRDWDAVITQLADNPISIRQAFLSPYKKFVRFVEEQVAKRAANAEAESTSRLASAAENTANLDKPKEPAPAPKKIDVGTVAALGVAVGGLTAAFGAIVGAFFGLGLWMPLGILGIMLAISGPSMLIAWIKLRQRTLGPLLESSGWAVNGRVKINAPLGRRLTQMAALPRGSRRSLTDPYEDTTARRQRRLAIGLVLLLLLAVVAGVIRWDRLQKGHYFWQPAPVEEPMPEAAEGADATTEAAPAEPQP